MCTTVRFSFQKRFFSSYSLAIHNTRDVQQPDTHILLHQLREAIKLGTWRENYAATLLGNQQLLNQLGMSSTMTGAMPLLSSPGAWPGHVAPPQMAPFDSHHQGPLYLGAEERALRAPLEGASLEGKNAYQTGSHIP